MGLKLLAELGLDGSGFESGLHKAQGMAKGFSEGLKSFAIQAIGIGTVAEAIRRTVETADELVNTSKRLSIAPEQLQVLRQAATNAGSSLDDLAGFFEKIDIAREKALGRGAEALNVRRLFGALGVSDDQLHNLSAAQLAMGPLSQTVRTQNPEELGILFRELGIRGFGPMIAVLKTNFDELGRKMKDMGAIMDADTAVKLKAVGQEFSLLSKIIVAQLGPALIKLIEVIYSGILKLGGQVAGASAFYGAGTAKMGIGETIGTLFRTAGLGAEHLVGAISDQELKDRMAGMGFDFKQATPAAEKAMEPFVLKLAQFEKMLEEFSKQGKELDHPKPPDFSGTSAPDKVPPKALQTVGDSMVKVGNFLGGVGLISQIDQQKISLARQTAQNTAAIVRILGGGIQFGGRAQFGQSQAAPTFGHPGNGTNFTH